MGSLPDLTERPRAVPPRTASRTVSDPNRNRNRTLPAAPAPAPLSIVAKEWSWRRTAPPPRHTAHLATTRRRDSVASSLGATSVRRLITRAPPKVPRVAVRRFTLLCVASALCATALLPFTALVGASESALAVSLMHAAAALVAPLSPFVLRKAGARLTVGVTHAAVCVLMAAHALDAPAAAVWPLYAVCGCTLAPMSMTLASAAVSLSTAAGDESRRRAALRRALRALRAAQDAGLVVGALLLGGSLALWPGELTRSLATAQPAPFNVSEPRWPPSHDEYYPDDDYEERTCGAAGCPEAVTPAGSALSDEGRRVLLAAWAGLALAAGALGAVGATSSPSPPADTRSLLADPRTLLAAPMGLFIGLQQGFIYTTYVKWYGVCVGGWWCAWRALLGAGALQALAAATLSMAAARGRRGALAAGGAAAHASLLLALLRWRAARTDLALPAVAAAAWGACAALWDVLQASICVGGAGWRGSWAATLSARHLGLALACAARRLLCVRTQLAALGVALLAALVSHAVLELRLRRAEPPRQRS